MHFEKFVTNRTGRLLMSIILGLGLAALFRKSCKDGRPCTQRVAPPLSEMDGKVYKFSGQCYKMEKEAVVCDASKKTYW